MKIGGVEIITWAMPQKQVFLFLKQRWPLLLYQQSYFRVVRRTKANPALRCEIYIRELHATKFCLICLLRKGTDMVGGYAEPGLARDLESCHKWQSSTLLWCRSDNWFLLLIKSSSLLWCSSDNWFLLLIKVRENFAQAAATAAEPAMSWQFQLQRCPGGGFCV